MSRSYKKTPILGNTNARSEKDDKRRGNRCLRHHNKQKIHVEDFEIFLEQDDIFTEWDMDKDGKHWVGDRLDEKWFVKSMRK